MEAALPIVFNTPKPNKDEDKIDFIEESVVKKGNEEYKIQFGQLENQLIIRIMSEISKNIFYYQQNYSIHELQNLSKIFAVYETVKDIILFLKNLKFEINEKNEEIVLQFNAFMPDGKSKLIELILKKHLMDNNNLIKFLVEEVKSIKANMSSLKNRYESEIKELKDEISNYQNDLSNIKADNANRDIIYKKEISNLKEENKKLWDEINKLKIFFYESKEIEKNKTIQLNSKITSINSINFILDYIRKNDKSFNFNEIKLLYRGSRDGDRTKTCHELCDNKQNVLIIMKSDTDHIFGGYSKIGFKINNNLEYKIDNNCFLFSIDSKKIYPVIKDKKVICNIDAQNGLCFYASLIFMNCFMNQSYNNYSSDRKFYFNGLEDDNEMNGGKMKFKFKEIEVFQLF